jgi:hypothetical protein
MGAQSEVEISSEAVAGVRFQKEFLPNAPGSKSGILEMRNGDLLRGELTELDGNGARFDESQGGMLSIPLTQIWRYLPKQPDGWCDGGFDPQGWLASSPAGSWIYVDGRYVSGPRPPYFRVPPSVWAPVQNPPEKFQVAFDVAGSNGNQPELTLHVGDRASASWLSIEVGPKGAFFTAAHRNANGVASIPQPINLGDCCSANPSKLEIRALVDAPAGIVEVYFNGTRCARIGSRLEDRLPGLDRKVSIQVDGAGAGAATLSNLRIEPWNGESPQWKHGGGFVSLNNGDVVDGTATALHEGRLGIESAAGRLELPLSELHAMELGGAKNSQGSARCVRLLDGGVIHLKQFEWDGRELIGKSEALGELRLPGAVLAELVWSPELIQPRSTAGEESTAQATIPPK